MSDIDSKVVLVTGASSGIGHATALTLAEDGHQLLVGARRTDRLDTLVETVRGAGGRVKSRALYVTGLASMRSSCAPPDRRRTRPARRRGQPPAPGQQLVGELPPGAPGA